MSIRAPAWAALAAALTATAGAATAHPLAAQQSLPPLEYTTFSLDNGLRFVVSEDHSVPIVAVNIVYYVGSDRERAGRSGFAHIFEHMLFQETRDLKKGEFMKMIPAAGGDFNGNTTTDRTMYFEVLPANRLNLAFWMEAERMGWLKVEDANFKREREVVKEERRRSVDNRPYGRSFLTLDTLAASWPPYKHTVIGTMDDLNAATAEDVRQFHSEFYNPNNATVVVVGDVTPDEVKRLANQYFGPIPKGPDVPPLPPPTPTPRTSGERRVTLVDSLATIPLYLSAYGIPPHRSDDTYSLELLSQIFSTGESSRLHQRLVKQEQAALQVFSALDSRYGPGLFYFGAIPNQGVDAKRIEALIQDEVQKLLDKGITERELQKAKNQTLADEVRSRQTALSKAVELQEALLYDDDLSAVNRDPERYQAVTVQDVMDVARKYLTPANRTVVITVPPGQAAQNGAAGGPATSGEEVQR